MGFFDMEYVDYAGNVLDINAKDKDGKPIANDGKGIWQFKHKILAPACLIIMIPFWLLKELFKILVGRFND